MTLAGQPVPHKEKGKRKFTVSHLSHLSPGRYQSKCRSNDCCDSHRPCCLTKNTTSQTEFLRSTSDHLTASCILFDIHWCTACTEWSAGSGHLAEMEIICSVVGGGEVGVCNYENCSTAAWCSSDCSCLPSLAIWVTCCRAEGGCRVCRDCSGKFCRLFLCIDWSLCETNGITIIYHTRLHVYVCKDDNEISLLYHNTKNASP